MRIVNATSYILGPQFDPYLRARLLPYQFDVEGKKFDMLSLVDPLEVEPSKRPKDTWLTEITHLK
jgi:hypothetical protein